MDLLAKTPIVVPGAGGKADEKKKDDKSSGAAAAPAKRSDLFSEWTPSSQSQVQQMASLLDEAIFAELATAIAPPVPLGKAEKKEKEKQDKAQPAAEFAAKGVTLTAEQFQAFRARMLARLDRELTIFQNTQYTRGYSARLAIPPANFTH